MSELTQHQRMATFIARHSHAMFPVMERFAEQLHRIVPKASAMFDLGTKTNRFAFAMAASGVCKRIDRLNEESGAVRGMRRKMARAGFTDRQMPEVRAAFIGCLRKQAGVDWDAQIESDWSEVMDRCFGKVNAAQSAMRMAA